MKLKMAMAASALVLSGAFMGSCRNELTYEPGEKTDSIAPYKAPSFFAWSGEQTFGGYRMSKYSSAYAVEGISTRADNFSDLAVNSEYFKICDFSEKNEWMQNTYPELYRYFDNAPSTTDRGEYVSTDEYGFVMDYLSKHPNEGYTECDLTTYFIQNVGSSEQTYHVDYIADNGGVHHSADIKACTQMNYLTIGGRHVPDYNATDGKRALVINVPVEDPTYHESYGDEENTKYDAYRYYYITYNGVTSVYLCFDYKVKKYDNGQLDYQGDGVYSDWVIKLTPADGSEVKVPETPSEGGQQTPDTPDVPGDPAVTNEVEINLSLNDSHEQYDVQDLVSKLSIHVRAATDVEVFIPVPAEYYCEADDLDVLLSHSANLLNYGAESVASYEIIPGHTVKVTVTFEQNGIRVTTDGIDQEIIDYCMETFGDGVNFEIWNYFNNEVLVGDVYQNAISRERLQEYLNLSTVRFLDKVPDYYVNAFNDVDETGEKFGGDCTVTPVDSQIGSFDEPYEGTHYNGSAYNEIYASKDLVRED